MMETTNTSLIWKLTSSPAPRRLTKPEIESLRQDRKEGHEWAKIALKDVKPLEP
ncbi:MAG: hypothetical protein Ta2A_26830 [Treponemataceae bacterium]|nr:MAG: hypothetical protein Ta2A_26830 [Treponemataceae bacterium]